ncbi:MAG: hypothetical protein AAF614_37920 [Chloroflexota bacterium]
MITLELPTAIEQKFLAIVQDGYNGNLQETIVAFLQLHEKYGWKEQLSRDVASVRAEVEARGGIRSEDIDDAIRAYRASRKS